MANTAQEWICETAKKSFSSHGPGVARQLVREMRKAGKFTPRSNGPDGLNLRDLAIECFGGKYVWEGRMREYGARKGWAAEASAEATDASVFRDFFGAVALEAVEVGYAQTAGVANQLVGVWESGTSDLDEATIPETAASADGNQNMNVGQGMDYGRASFTGVWVKAPRPDKFGLIAALTLEFVKGNMKTEVLDAHAEVGRMVGTEEAERKYRVIIGAVNNYNRLGTSTNTYLTSGAYINSLTDFVLTNGPKEIDRLLRLASGMTHPITGKNISFAPTAILTVPGGVFNARHQANLSEYREPAVSTSNVVGISQGNPLGQNFSIMSDSAVERIAALSTSAELPGLGLTAAKATSLFILADFQKAFKWRQVEPFQTWETGDLSNDYWPPAFFQDVVWACKARSWGAAFVREPRQAYRGYNNAL